jgi:hypothetical protein
MGGWCGGGYRDRRWRCGQFAIIPDDAWRFWLAACFAASGQLFNHAAPTAGIGFDPVAVMAISAIIRPAQQDAAIKIGDEFMVRPLEKVLPPEHAHEPVSRKRAKILALSLEIFPPVNAALQKNP